MSEHVCPYCNGKPSFSSHCCDAFKALRDSVVEGMTRSAVQSSSLFNVPLTVNDSVAYNQSELLPFDKHFQLPL